MTHGCHNKLFTWSILTRSNMSFNNCDMVLAGVEKDVRAAFVTRCRMAYGDNEGPATGKSDSSVGLEESGFDDIKRDAMEKLMAEFRQVEGS